MRALKSARGPAAPGADPGKAAAFLVVCLNPLAIRWSRGLVEVVSPERLEALKKNLPWENDI